jgi:hypothetical protein
MAFVSWVGCASFRLRLNYYICLLCFLYIDLQIGLQGKTLDLNCKSSFLLRNSSKAFIILQLCCWIKQMLFRICVFASPHAHKRHKLGMSTHSLFVTPSKLLCGSYLCLWKTWTHPIHESRSRDWGGFARKNVFYQIMSILNVHARRYTKALGFSLAIIYSLVRGSVGKGLRLNFAKRFTCVSHARSCWQEDRTDDGYQQFLYGGFVAIFAFSNVEKER